MKYKVILLDLRTNKQFEKEIKNEFFLRQFKNKVKYSKKITIIGVIELYK